MFQDDKIMREIRRVIEAILNMRKSRRDDNEEWKDVLDGALLELTRFPQALLDRMSDDTLVSMLSGAGVIDGPRALALAFLLDERSECEPDNADWLRARSKRLRDEAEAAMDRHILDSLLAELTPHFAARAAFTARTRSSAGPRSSDADAHDDAL